MLHLGKLSTNKPQLKLFLCFIFNFINFYSEWRDESLWESRDKSKDKYYKDKPYYGIKGVKKVSNRFIAAGCVAFMVAGAVFHFFVVK